ncbi:MAG: peptide chain release factor 2 [Pantoea sp. Brub]|nr:peptide chain release factor 2 [Pantoea sp. Brub]
MLDIHVITNRFKNLNKRINTLRGYFDYNQKLEKLKTINDKLQKLHFWTNKEYVKVINKEKLSLETSIKYFDKIFMQTKDIQNIIELFNNVMDKNVFNEIMSELDSLELNIKKLDCTLMFSKKDDFSNCYIDLQAGSGGVEAQDWTNMLMRMYLRWVESKSFKTEIIEESLGDIAGIKSATIYVSGAYAFGWLRTETGIHRLVRKSPFDCNHRRHTSFSSVFVYPELNDSINTEVNLADLRIDFYRASGAGGQHVNRTESAVRITHIPTGVITQCQNSRSQHKNKEQAFKQLKAKLYELEIQKQNTEKQLLKNNKACISWGNQIRSYVLDNARIKDLRTGVETNNIQAVLNGNLDQFIEKSLKIGL